MQTFSHATDDVMRKFLRAYTLALLSIMLCINKLGNEVRLFLLPLLRDFEEARASSWSTTVLGCLYRELCRNIT